MYGMESRQIGTNFALIIYHLCDKDYDARFILFCFTYLRFS